MSHPPPEQPSYGYQYPYPYWQQPQWRPPPPIDPKRLRPSRLWYWLSPIPALVGVAIAAMFAVQFFDDFDADIDNFRANRPAEVHLEKGEHTIYVQTVGAESARDVPASELDCRVAPAGGGSPLRVDRAGSLSLDLNGDSYESKLTFDAPRDGRYGVECRGPAVPLAVGPHISFGVFRPLVAALLALLVGAALTTTIAVVTAVKRSGHKQRLQREAMGQG